MTEQFQINGHEMPNVIDLELHRATGEPLPLDSTPAREPEALLDTVMVACPIYSGKDYALPPYLQAYNAFSWPYRSLYMVDDTGKGPFYYEHLMSLGIPCEHVDPARTWNETFIRSWKHIWREAVRRNVRWVASVETDVICPPITLDVLLNFASFCGAVHVAHSYAWHKSQAKQGRLIGLGCNLILTDLLTKIFAQDRWYTDSFECELFEYPKLHGQVAVEIHNVLDLRHLDPPPGAEYYHFASEPMPNLTPGNVGERVPIVYNKPAPTGE